ncbi:MAG: hypothetical protein MUE56_10305 [Ignavibacteria bacterium]|nr:hypothetical protein [Ignavibacteria bacterium]
MKFSPPVLLKTAYPASNIDIDMITWTETLNEYTKDCENNSMINIAAKNR